MLVPPAALQVLAFVAVVRCWQALTPAITAWLLAYLAALLAVAAGQGARPASFARRREVAALLLRLASFGGGLGWVLSCRFLDGLDVSTQPTLLPQAVALLPQLTAGRGPGGTLLELLPAAASAASHVAILAFASGAVCMVYSWHSMRARLRCGGPAVRSGNLRLIDRWAYLPVSSQSARVRGPRGATRSRGCQRCSSSVWRLYTQRDPACVPGNCALTQQAYEPCPLARHPCPVQPECCGAGGARGLCTAVRPLDLRFQGVGQPAGACRLPPHLLRPQPPALLPARVYGASGGPPRRR